MATVGFKGLIQLLTQTVSSACQLAPSD